MLLPPLPPLLLPPAPGRPLRAARLPAHAALLDWPACLPACSAAATSTWLVRTRASCPKSWSLSSEHSMGHGPAPQCRTIARPEGPIAAALCRCLLPPMLLARLCSLDILNTCATSPAAAGTTPVCSGTCCSLRPSSSERRSSCAFPLARGAAAGAAGECRRPHKARC